MSTAVIFDLDGTLVDSAPDLHAAANAMLAEIDQPPLSLAEIIGFIGNGVPKLVERCLSARGVFAPETLEDHVTRFRHHYEADPVALTRHYPGVAEALNVLSHGHLHQQAKRASPRYFGPFGTGPPLPHHYRGRQLSHPETRPGDAADRDGGNPGAKSHLCG